MGCWGTWPKQALKAAWVTALLCTFAFAETASSTSASSKSAKKPTTHQSSSAAHSSAHHSRSTTAHSATSAKSKKSSTHATSTHATSHKGKKSRASNHRGQQKIDGDRTLQIQQALIKQNYLSGEPSGKWDASTEEALRRFQADNGWQNKTVPDSRALIKLGLGPSHDHLLNPESAMTTAPDPRAPGVGKPASGSAEPGPAPNQPN